MEKLKQNVLGEANSLIYGDREKDYGDPKVNFEKIASLWSAYTGTKITPTDVCLMMTLLKMARLSTGGVLKRDTIVDGAAYWGVIERVTTLTEPSEQLHLDWHEESSKHPKDKLPPGYPYGRVNTESDAKERYPRYTRYSGHTIGCSAWETDVCTCEGASPTVGGLKTCGSQNS